MLSKSQLLEGFSFDSHPIPIDCANDSFDSYRLVVCTNDSFDSYCLVVCTNDYMIVLIVTLLLPLVHTFINEATYSP